MNQPQTSSKTQSGGQQRSSGGNVMAAAERLERQKHDYDYQYRCMRQGTDQALLADAFLANRAAADRLAYACAKAIMRGDLRTRSAIDDALLHYLNVGGPDGPCDVHSWLEEHERRVSGE